MVDHESVMAPLHQAESHSVIAAVFASSAALGPDYIALRSEAPTTGYPNEHQVRIIHIGAELPTWISPYVLRFLVPFLRRRLLSDDFLSIKFHLSTYLHLFFLSSFFHSTLSLLLELMHLLTTDITASDEPDQGVRSAQWEGVSSIFGDFHAEGKGGGAWARSRGTEAVAVDDVIDEWSTGEANGM